jgi:hypothetical protein
MDKSAEYAQRKRVKYHTDVAHRKTILARNTAWHKAHPEKLKVYQRKWYAKNAKKVQRRQKAWHEALRDRVFAAYGYRCKCCGETGKWFLTIDHVNGRKDATHKRHITGWTLYRWLERHGYPQDEFRCLCFNCNCARGILGYCPHERER